MQAFIAAFIWATTDFYQIGVSTHFRRLSFSADTFQIAGMTKVGNSFSRVIGAFMWIALRTLKVRRGVEFDFTIDNFTDLSYYETQNYFESRITPTAPVVSRIHGTLGYPLTVAAGVTFRLAGK